MVKPRRAQPTVKFIDNYCEGYRDLFPEVRAFEYFKYLHLGMISEIKRKTLPAIAKVVGLEDAEGLNHFLTESPWSVEELKERRLKMVLNLLDGEKIIVIIDETGDKKKGRKTDHVKRQYIGNLGKIENGIVAVTAWGLFRGMTFPLIAKVYKSRERLKEGDEYKGRLFSERTYNLIYQAVFNQQWVKQKLANLRPYYAQLLAWKNSESQEKAYLLQGSELQQALTWSSGQILDELDQKFLSASQHWNQQQKNQKIIKFSSFGVLAGLATFSLLTLGNNWLKNYNVQYCSVLEKVGDTCFRDVLSSGESKFFLSRRNYYLDKGIVEFNKKDYSAAKNLFEKAINAAPKDPVPQIFYNNAQARIESQKSGEISYKFAAVIPADSNESIAIEILRGIADSQTKFNEKGGKNYRLLEIVLVNDGDEPDPAPRVARRITSDKDILAVIGHYSSDTTGKSLPEYDRASLAIVSPTSVSSKLDEARQKLPHKVFFRTVPNNRQLKILAKYIKEKMKLDTAVVFYEKASEFYSKSGKEIFIKEYEKLGGKVDKNGDGMINTRDDDQAKDVNAPNVQLDSPNLNVEQNLKEIIAKKQIKAVVVIPSVKTISIAISLAKENNKQLPFFGVGGTLYNPDIIEQGGELLEGLTLDVPFFNQNSTYSQASQKRWRGEITYRTAGAYDATQALIKSLEQAKKPTREAILAQLRTIDLSADEASGQPVKFDQNGNIIGRKYVIITLD